MKCFAPCIPLKGAAAASGAEDIKTETHALEEEIRCFEGNEATVQGEAIDRVSVRLARIRQLLSTWLGVVDGPAEEEMTNVRVVAPEHLRVDPDKVDTLHALVGELIITRLQRESVTTRIAQVRDQLIDLSNVLRNFREEIEDSARRETSAPLKTRVGVLGASALELSKSVGSCVRELATLDAQGANLSAGLDDSVRALRLMALEPFLEEYAQVVRETARESGKEARLRIAAEGAQVDRAILHRLREPLLHLVRNAVAHGLESPERRRSLGKPPVGTVIVEARCEAMRVILRISDDGSGIDAHAVARRAISAGLVDPTIMPEQLEAEDLLDLITRPGFSTRDSSDLLAGRGIGLDVVASRVQELEGVVHLDNIPGSGCSFTLEVPVMASTSAGFMLQVGGHGFAVLLVHVERVIRIGSEDAIQLEGRDAVLVAGVPVAVVSLAAMLGLSKSPIEARRRPAIVIRQGKQRLALLVDDVPGDQALIVRPLPRAFGGASLFAGGAIQPDGSVLPVLHVPALFERAVALSDAVASRQALPIDPVRRPPSSPVLVVDDSMTMRTMLRNILRAAGYPVTVACDGRAALAALTSMHECALVITDLQMPTMDGVELCRALRQSERATLPIVMVTSVANEQERRQALAAGADHYIVKSEFEQHRFLELVSRLTGVTSNA